MPEPNSGCWLWINAINRQGYGRFRVEGIHKRAHRVSYEMYVAPIPKGMQCLHHCDIPGCVNPDHLFIGTVADNAADMMAKGRNNPVKGEAHGASKLIEAQVLAIREDSRLQRVIASDYNVDKSLISYIKTRKIWSHI